MKHLDITVEVNLVASAGSLGFGYPLILTSKAEKELAYTKVSGLKELADKLGTDYADNATYKVAQLIFMQENAPSEIAICHHTGTMLEAITELQEEEWRQLLCIIGKDDATTKKIISDNIETIDYKMYFPTDADEADIEKYNGNKRTVPYYYDLKDDSGNLVQPYASAALVGATAGRDAGSFTYKNMILKGIDPLDLTTDKLSQLNTIYAITNVKKCGDNVTTEGKTASGEYADIVDSIDFVTSQIKYRVQKLLNKTPKIAYTNSGIASIEAEVVGVLEKAYGNGIIADEDGIPQYTTNFKTRDEMSSEDRTNRIYTGGNFSFQVAGAIHTIEVHGELII